MSATGAIYNPESASYYLPPSADCGSPPQAILPWFVIHCKGGHEQRASQNLESWGIEVFLPLIKSRNLKLLQPLFPCYTFARISPEIYSSIPFTRGALGIVSFGGQPAPIEEEAIEIIRTEVKADGLYHGNDLRIGEEVIVTAEKYRDLRGIVRKQSGERLTILLKNLQFSWSVAVDRWDVVRA